MNKTNGQKMSGVMLNAYPDSMGGNLTQLIKVLKQSEFEDCFSFFYVLPTFFNSDLDRGFSIIDYDLNSSLVSDQDLKDLKDLHIELKFDIVLNHLSVASPQFKDLLQNGKNSKFKDFFINWNEFWEGHGELNKDGIIIPEEKYLSKLFMRKSGLPILEVEFPDGSKQPYWNTFYQKISVDENGNKRYLGQMDVNAKSKLVWDFYDQTLKKLSEYGCKILRLDAFAYLHKEVGLSNFFNEPGTWDHLQRIRSLADQYHLSLLPEIHAEYGQGLHKQVADKDYTIYDFFLPGLCIHTIETASSSALKKWILEIQEEGYRTVNMLGCHDGIPVLDLKGLLSDEQIQNIMDTILDRGGMVKNLYDADGNKISYYQINATYYSALGENDQKMLLARAIQLFTPGIPQIWYLDLFGGTNDYKAVEEGGSGAHKEINRTNLTSEEMKDRLKSELVVKQLQLIQLRNTSSAFLGTMTLVDTEDQFLHIKWENENDLIELIADLNTYNFEIRFLHNGDLKSYHY